MKITRKILKELKWDKAILIQAAYRGHLGRRRFQQIRKERGEAAVRLQTRWRMMLARREKRRRVREQHKEKEIARKAETRRLADLRQQRQFEEAYNKILLRSMNRAAVKIQTRTREFLRIRRIQLKAEKKVMLEEEARRQLLDREDKRKNDTGLLAQARRLTENIKNFTISKTEQEEIETKKRSELSEEEFLRRENYKREEKALEIRETVNNIKAFFSKDVKAEQEQKLEEKIKYSVLARQKILVHQGKRMQ